MIENHEDIELAIRKYEKMLSQGKHLQATAFIEATLETVQDKFGKTSMELTGILDALGQGCREGRKLADARQYFSRSLIIKTRVLGPMHPDVATALRRVAACLGDDENDKRHKLHTQAREIDKNAGMTDTIQQYVLTEEYLAQLQTPPSQTISEIHGLATENQHVHAAPNRDERTDEIDHDGIDRNDEINEIEQIERHEPQKEYENEIHASLRMIEERLIAAEKRDLQNLELLEQINNRLANIEELIWKGVSVIETDSSAD